MRPVRFVALSEDGYALVLADEVGRLLTLPIDERVAHALNPDKSAPAQVTVAAVPFDGANSLSPRDIQSRIRSGESADDVARIAGVPVDRVLRYAGPVLQERAMLAQHARRTRLKDSDKGTLADVVDGRLAQHGIDTEKISWDAYRREDGTWRIVATWPSGKATAQAVWELDRNRQQVSAHDDMAHYLCAERSTQILGQDPAAGQVTAPSRSGRDLTGGHGVPAAGDGPRRPGRDPIRSGRDALVAALDRQLESGPGRGLDAPADKPRQRSATAAFTVGGQGSAFDNEPDAPKEVPAVPSLAVLRPRRQAEPADPDKPRKRLPSWDDVLFGSTPAARE